MPIDFTKYADFRTVMTEFKDLGIMVIGFFPYECATIDNKDVVRTPRSLYKDIEHDFRINGINTDNKTVIVCEPLNRFGGESFVLQLKDNWARVAPWNEVVPYHGKKFRLK